MEHQADLERLVCLLGTFIDVLRSLAAAMPTPVHCEIASVATELEGIAERLLKITAAPEGQ